MIKKFILRFFTFTAILYMTSNFIHGFNASSFYSVIALAVFLTIGHFVVSPTMTFLTIPKNFLTLTLFNGVIAFVFINLFNFIIAGFNVTNGKIDGVTSSNVQIPAITLSKMGVLIASSLLIGALNNLITWCTEGSGKKKKKSED